MKYKFNIGDCVRVLDGQDIPDYTGGWNSEMNRYVSLNAIVIKQKDTYKPYPSYMLQFVNSLTDLERPSTAFIWDERGLELSDSTSLRNNSTEVENNTNAVVDCINKGEVAAFAKDLRAMCDSWDGHCEYCPLGDVESWTCKGEMLSHNFDIESAVAAVESYRKRKRKKPCPEVIDKALDIYTIKVIVERNTIVPTKYLLSVKSGAQYAKKVLDDFYVDVDKDAAVRILSTKRFIPESQEYGNYGMVDVYILEIETIRTACEAENRAIYFAKELAEELLYNYKGIGKTAFYDVLSAKRFVLESHREDNK